MSWLVNLLSRRPGPRPPVPLVHSINDDLCIGCEACISVCPVQVLELVKHKCRLVKPGCIECRKCDEFCPTHALVMHRKGQEPRPLQVPDVDEFGQSRAVPGLYLIGEAAGQPLVKNAVNMGRAAVAHLARTFGPQARGHTRGGDNGLRDVIIVGAGPAGLSAALTCVELGLTYTVLERHGVVASTIADYPKRKRVMSEPPGVKCHGLLPVFEDDKDRVVQVWQKLLSSRELDIRFHEQVTKVARELGAFAVTTSRGSCIQGRQLILAIGTRGQPNRLNIPGESLEHVRASLKDPDAHRSQKLLVVGGGDSAVEAALALAQPELGNRVTLCIRGAQVTRANQRNRMALAAAVTEHRVTLWPRSIVQRIELGTTVMTVAGREQRAPTDYLFLFIGSEPPWAWLAQVGIVLVPRPHRTPVTRSDELVTRLLGPQMDNCSPLRPRPLPGQPAAALASRDYLRSTHDLLLLRLPERFVPTDAAASSAAGTQGASPGHPHTGDPACGL